MPPFFRNFGTFVFFRGCQFILEKRGKIGPLSDDFTTFESRPDSRLANEKVTRVLGVGMRAIREMKLVGGVCILTLPFSIRSSNVVALKFGAIEMRRLSQHGWRHPVKRGSKNETAIRGFEQRME